MSAGRDVMVLRRGRADEGDARPQAHAGGGSRSENDEAAPRSGCGLLVARGGVEPPTFRFSVGRSYQLSYLASRHPQDIAKSLPRERLATPTGLEPATSAVTGRRANQLRYGASW